MNKKEKRKFLTRRTKQIIETDHSLREYEKNGQKPFSNLSLEQGCNILVTEPFYPSPKPNDLSSQ